MTALQYIGSRQKTTSNINDAAETVVDHCFSLTYVLLNMNFHLLMFCNFGLFLCYIIELHLRQRYRDTGTIFRWKKSSETTSTSTTNIANQEDRC